MAGAFYGSGHFFLVFEACTRQAAGQNLSLRIQKPYQKIGVFVVNVFDAVLFEAAKFDSFVLVGRVDGFVY